MIPARRFLARTVRLPAYQGVLTARIAAEQQDQPAPTASGEEVSIDDVNLLVPGLIERVEV